MKFTVEKLTIDTYYKSNFVWNMSTCPFTKQFKEQVECGNREAYLFKFEDEYIASCDLVYDYEDYTENNNKIYLSRLIVKREYRNQGIGQSVLKYMIDVCKEKGYQYITVGVDVDNDNAIHLYKKKGFKIYENAIDEYGEYYKMILNL